MGLSEIMGIISIIMFVALIPEIFFKKEYSRIEDKINQVKAEDSTIEENLYYIRLEIGKIRKIFLYFFINHCNSVDN
jgi:hypothetical protein